MSRGLAVINKLVNNDKYGALAEVFVIEAVAYYAESILKNPPPTEHGNGLISVIAWHELADHCMKTLVEDRLVNTDDKKS